MLDSPWSVLAGADAATEIVNKEKVLYGHSVFGYHISLQNPIIPLEDVHAVGALVRANCYLQWKDVPTNHQSGSRSRGRRVPRGDLQLWDLHVRRPLNLCDNRVLVENDARTHQGRPKRALLTLSPELHPFSLAKIGE